MLFRNPEPENAESPPRQVSESSLYLLDYIWDCQLSPRPPYVVAITDASGAVIAQASVSLVQNTTGSVREGKSNTEGFYEFPLLQPGTYDLKVSASGFNAAERNGVELLSAYPPP